MSKANERMLELLRNCPHTDQEGSCSVCTWAAKRIDQLELELIEERNETARKDDE